MIYQVNDTIKRSNYAVRGIRKIKPYVSLSVRKTLVVSLVLSRIDFLNSLYSSLNRKDVRRLDVMLNNSARLITGTNPRASITPVLNSLHWLKIEYRIKYKLCIFVHKSVHLGCVPTYISELFTVNENPVIRKYMSTLRAKHVKKTKKPKKLSLVCQTVMILLNLYCLMSNLST